MPIKPLQYDGPLEIPGFVFSGMHAGIKKNAQPDLALIQNVGPKAATCAGLFTCNYLKSSHIILGREKLQRTAGKCRAVVINSGNANACTGQRGLEDAERICSKVAKHLDCSADDIQIASTGVIGQFLPVENILNAIPTLLKEANSGRLPQAAEAIRTTDTFSKVYRTTCSIDGKIITLGGFAKGSGMIQPHMATMLSYLLTDARVEADVLHDALQEACEHTFGAITVDGESSPNDTVLLLANGHASNAEIKKGSQDYAVFLRALVQSCDFLSRQIVRDGEGVSKFVELRVSGMNNKAALKTVAYAIANSYLVRTAICGEDANWGRILSAAGACAARLSLPAEAIDFDRASIFFDDVAVFQNGKPVGKEAEDKAHTIMTKDAFALKVVLGPHPHEHRLYTNDLTKEYVRINAEYRS